MSDYSLKEYKICFFTEGLTDDGQTFGCSASDIAAGSIWNSNLGGSHSSAGNEPAVWDIRPRGMVIGGRYQDVLDKIKIIMESGFSPDAAIPVFARNEGIERFLSRFSALTGDIPLCGGGASPVSGGSDEGVLIPFAQNVNILLIKDDRYIWSSDWKNFLTNTCEQGEKLYVRIASPRTILSVRPDGENSDVPALQWYAEQCLKYNVPEGCFEQIALAVKEGYNLHLSPEGEFALHTGSNVPPECILTTKRLIPDDFNRDIAEYCLQENRLIFSCAGLRSQITSSFTVGKKSIAGFFHGEVMGINGAAKFGNLMTSSLVARIRRNY